MIIVSADKMVIVDYANIEYIHMLCYLEIWAEFKNSKPSLRLGKYKTLENAQIAMNRLIDDLDNNDSACIRILSEEEIEKVYGKAETDEIDKMIESAKTPPMTLKEASEICDRLCDTFDSRCTGCPLRSEDFDCEELIDCISKIENPLRKWNEENPIQPPCPKKVKTYRQDFMEKHPNCLLDEDVPAACRKNIYGKAECEHSCYACWNEPMPEEQK